MSDPENNDGTTDLRPPHFRQEQSSGESPPIYVDPGVNPAAAAYAAGAQARQQRRKASPPKYSEPVAGEQVAIPRLDAPHQEGMTMAAQAGVGGPTQDEMLSSAHQQAQAGGGSIIEPSGAPPFTPQGGAPSSSTSKNLSLQPGDTLPDEAKKDPEYLQGTGSSFAMNQPRMAAKYGVIRNHQRVAPQALVSQQPRQAGAQPQGGLRPETLRDLEQLEHLHRNQGENTSLPQSDEEAEAQVHQSAAAHSSRAGSTAQEKELTEEERAKVKEAIQGMDSFDYDKLQEVMNRDILNNPEQQKIIESRLQPIDVSELIIRNKATQDVPIIEGFVVTYESMTGEEDIALKRLIMEESKSVEVTDRYLLDKFAFMSIACGLKAINKNPLPSHVDEEGNFNDEKFWLKFNWVLKRPIHMLASIGVNHTWFEMRMRKLFVAKKS